MKKAILFISALALSGAATAQSGIKNAVVNVENDYTPEVIEVTKKNFTPSDETKSDVTPMSLMFSTDKPIILFLPSMRLASSYLISLWPM